MIVSDSKRFSGVPYVPKPDSTIISARCQVILLVRIEINAPYVLVSRRLQCPGLFHRLDIPASNMVLIDSGELLAVLVRVPSTACQLVEALALKLAYGGRLRFFKIIEKQLILSQCHELSSLARHPSHKVEILVINAKIRRQRHTSIEILRCHCFFCFVNLVQVVNIYSLLEAAIRFNVTVSVKYNKLK